MSNENDSIMVLHTEGPYWKCGKGACMKIREREDGTTFMVACVYWQVYQDNVFCNLPRK